MSIQLQHSHMEVYEYMYFPHAKMHMSLYTAVRMYTYTYVCRHLSLSLSLLSSTTGHTSVLKHPYGLQSWLRTLSICVRSARDGRSYGRHLLPP